MNYIIPYIYEKDGQVEKSWDIYSRLLKDRIIFIGSVINDQVANAIIAQLLFLQMDNPNKDINLYINSVGGNITSGMAIYDTMNFVKCDINTYCIGMVASVATIIASSGTKGKRYALPNANILLNQPRGIVTGQAEDISITTREILKWKNKLNEILSINTGKNIKTVEIDSQRDFYMTALEGKNYGIIDEVIKPNK